jgi:hypothetical protein
MRCQRRWNRLRRGCGCRRSRYVDVSIAPRSKALSSHRCSSWSSRRECFAFASPGGSAGFVAIGIADVTGAIAAETRPCLCCSMSAVRISSRRPHVGPIQWALCPSCESMTARVHIAPHKPLHMTQPRCIAPPPHSSHSWEKSPADQFLPQDWQ